VPRRNRFIVSATVDASTAGGQRARGLPDDRPGHLEQLTQFALGGQLVARVKSSVEDVLEQLLRDLIGQPGAPGYGYERV
jgi:hypothetical protein